MCVYVGVCVCVPVCVMWLFRPCITDAAPFSFPKKESRKLESHCSWPPSYRCGFTADQTHHHREQFPFLSGQVVLVVTSEPSVDRRCDIVCNEPAIRIL